MSLTPDQRHIFQVAGTWKEFRALFPNRNEAFQAYATAAQADAPPAPTHVIEWRRVYHDRESGFLLALALLTLPLGIHYTKHNEFRFTTRHTFTPPQLKQLFWGRTLGSLCYHACFALLILCGGAIAVGIIIQLLNGFSVGVALLTLLGVAVFVALMIAAGKCRSLGLPPGLKQIAKDTFDLLSIRKLPAK